MVSSRRPGGCVPSAWDHLFTGACLGSLGSPKCGWALEHVAPLVLAAPAGLVALLIIVFFFSILCVCFFCPPSALLLEQRTSAPSPHAPYDQSVSPAKGAPNDHNKHHGLSFFPAPLALAFIHLQRRLRHHHARRPACQARPPAPRLAHELLGPRPRPSFGPGLFAPAVASARAAR